MTQAKHVPGPWSIMEFQRSGGYGPVRSIVRDVEGESVSEICELVEDYAPGVADANARLLAAAPDMLEMLRANFWESIGGDFGDRRDAIIARIEGKEHTE